MRTRSRIGAACCGLVMLAAGCGGGRDRLSTSAYVRRASGICVRANQAVARVDIPSFGDGDGVAHAMARIVVIQRSSIGDLRRLRPPDRLGSVSQRWIALLDQGTDELELMATTLGAGRRTEAERYGDHASKLLARARVLVAPHGMTSCRGPAFALA